MSEIHLPASRKPPFTFFAMSALALIVGWTAAPSVTAQEATFDNGTWNTILETHVDENGWVDYKAVRAKHRDTLKAYIRDLGKASVDKLKSKEEKMAFWINAYNAVCVQTLLDNDIPESVPRAVFFGKNIFKERTYRVGGKIRSLEDIEHGILRKVYKDPRIHATLVCGASSCPRLRPEAYSGEKLNAQLDEESQRWVQVGKDKSGKRKNRLDRASKTYYVSKIFDWFEGDFGRGEAGVLNFLKKHGSKEDAEFLNRNKVRIKYLDYSWKINSK